MNTRTFRTTFLMLAVAVIAPAGALARSLRP